MALCVPGGDPGFVAVTTSTGRDLQIQIEGQLEAASPGLPSLRKVISRTYRAATWLSHLPGFPQPGAEASEEDDLESEPESEEEEDESSEHTRRENEFTSGGVGITTTSLASGLHRVLKVTRGTPAALSGVINAGDTLTQIDNVVLKDAQSEAVVVLLTGPRGSEVELGVLSVNGISEVVRLRRVA